MFIPDATITPQCRMCFSEKLKFLQMPPAEDISKKIEGSSSESSGDSSETVESFHSATQDGPTFIGAPTEDDDSVDEAPLKRPKH